MICFQVTLNGERLTTAGIPGFAVLSTVVTWVRSRHRPEPYRSKGVLDFRVGGLDANPRKHADRKHVEWVKRDLAVGDVLEVRILESESSDPPSPVEWPEADSARRSNRYYLKEHLKRRKEIDAVIVRLKRHVRKEEQEKAKRKSKTRRRARA